MDHENLISRIEIAAKIGVQPQTIARADSSYCGSFRGSFGGEPQVHYASPGDHGSSRATRSDRSHGKARRKNLHVTLCRLTKLVARLRQSSVVVERYGARTARRRGPAIMTVVVSLAIVPQALVMRTQNGVKSVTDPLCCWGAVPSGFETSNRAPRYHWYVSGSLPLAATKSVALFPTLPMTSRR